MTILLTFNEPLLSSRNDEQERNNDHQRSGDFQARGIVTVEPNSGAQQPPTMLDSQIQNYFATLLRNLKEDEDSSVYSELSTDSDDDSWEEDDELSWQDDDELYDYGFGENDSINIQKRRINATCAEHNGIEQTSQEINKRNDCNSKQASRGQKQEKSYVEMSVSIKK